MKKCKITYIHNKEPCNKYYKLDNNTIANFVKFYFDKYKKKTIYFTVSYNKIKYNFVSYKKIYLTYIKQLNQSGGELTEGTFFGLINSFNNVKYNETIKKEYTDLHFLKKIEDNKIPKKISNTILINANMNKKEQDEQKNKIIFDKKYINKMIKGFKISIKFLDEKLALLNSNDDLHLWTFKMPILYGKINVKRS